MNVSVQTQAVLLLTAWFSKPAKSDPKPLTPAEWGRFALWLKSRSLAPEDLLCRGDAQAALSNWSDRSITPERIDYLLGRAGALGLALEKWQRAGLWVMTRSDPDYPSRLKKRLKFDAPPLLFGCGNRALLEQGGIAVVGSRDATAADLAFTAELGGEISMQGFSLVSGGARGVDETAMLGALDREGTVIGVLADSLLRVATSAKYRPGLMAHNLALVSPFNPEAGFDVGNAMARNKYIYCLSDAAVVVATGKDKGGTWNGALENLKQAWVPLWVKAHADPDSGNAALVGRGARCLPDGPLALSSLFHLPVATAEPVPPAGLFDEALSEVTPPMAISEPRPAGVDTDLTVAAPPVPDAVASEVLSLFDFFLLKLARTTAAEPQTLEVLQTQFDIHKSQLNDWLKRALAEGKVNKFTKPIRYQSADVGQRRLAL